MSNNVNDNSSFPTYSLALSNFLASFGGGMLLGEAMGLLKNTPFLKGDSLLAYLLGTSLGLFVLKYLGKNKLLQQFTKYSILAACSSVILLVMLVKFHDSVLAGGGWSYLFFLILVVRFGCWFLARIVRVDISAGIGKNLAWTELSYYIGAIVGLIVWPSGALGVSIYHLLMIDICAQAISAGLDNYSFHRLKNSLHSTFEHAVQNYISWKIFVPLAGFVVCLTVATQIVEFGFATFSVDFFADGKNFATNIVAAGYVGAALGAWLLGKISVEYQEKPKTIGAGKISFKNFSLHMMFFCVLCFLFLGLAFLMPFTSIGPANTISLVMFALSALVYDLIVLVILDQLGKSAKQVGDVGCVAKVYAYMGAIGTLCMFVFVRVLKEKGSFIFTSLLFFMIGYLFLSFYLNSNKAEEK